MKSERKLTPLTQRLFAAAVEAGLEQPLGRALAQTNRHYNDGLGSGTAHYRRDESVDLTMMRRFRKTTALRWLRHWRMGGSLKSLRRNLLEEKALRRKNRAHP